MTLGLLFPLGAVGKGFRIVYSCKRLYIYRRHKAGEVSAFPWEGELRKSAGEPLSTPQPHPVFPQDRHTLGSLPFTIDPDYGILNPKPS